MTKLDFPTGLGLYVGLSHPNIKLEIVKSPCTLLIFNFWDRKRKDYVWIKIIYANCWIFGLVNRIEHRMFHLLIIFVVLEWQMYHYIYCYTYPFYMTSNALLSRCQGDLLLPRAKMMLKRKQYLHKKQKFFKGSDEHFTFLLSLIGLPQDIM